MIVAPPGSSPSGRPWTRPGSAHREAAAQYRRALRALGRTGDAARARLLARCSQECALSDQIEDAHTHAEEALLLWRSMGDRSHEGDALRWLSSLAWMSDRAADAVRIGRESVMLLDRLPEGLALARACATLGQQYALTHALDDALPLLNRASSLADGLAAPEIAARAGIDLGLAYALRRDPGGEEQLEAAVQRARELGLDLDAARGMYQLGRAAWGFGRHGEAEQWLLATEAFCVERGLEHVRDFALALRANILLDRGEWHLAEELARDVWRRTTPASSTARTVAVGIVLGRLHARRGTADHDDALAVASRRGDTIAEHAVVIGLPAARAEAAWLAGRAATEVADLLAAREVARADPVTGDRDLAEICWWLRLAGEKDVHAEGTGPFAAQTAGDWRGAADQWKELDRPYHRAQALAAASEEEPLREAFDICRTLGAVPLGRIVTRRLRGLGTRNIPRLTARRSALPNAAGLTARELEVLALLADGMRDAEIAAELVISERTVHHHVGEILRKLDARSRTAAVASAARMGVDGKKR